MTRTMRNRELVQLLTDLHRSIDRVAEDLAPDRPDLAHALLAQSAAIPRPEVVARGEAIAPPPPPRALGPLLYHALDEGALDGRRFDVLMVQRLKAERMLRAREGEVAGYGVSEAGAGSPSDSESTSVPGSSTPGSLPIPGASARR